MQFGLTESQQVLKNSAREFFTGEVQPALVRQLMETATAHDEALWKKMAVQGWCGMAVPEAYEGMGLGLVEIAAAMEEIGRALVPGPLLAHLTGTAAIAAVASEEQKKRLLPAMANGEKIATLALLEAGASWDIDAVEMAGLDGTKLFVMDADVADFLVVVTRGGVYLVDAKSDGVTIEAMPGIDLTRRLSAVHFKGAKGELLSSSAKDVCAALSFGATAMSAEMVGGMAKVVEVTVAYVKARKQFGKAVGGYQLVQALCADMLLLTESSRSAAYFAAYAIQEGLPEAAAAVSVAKSYANDAYREVCNKGIQCHGGMGFTWENDLHLYYRRSKASETAFGDAAYHRNRIADLVL